MTVSNLTRHFYNLLNISKGFSALQPGNYANKEEEKSTTSVLFNHKAMTEELLLFLLYENYITGFCQEQVMAQYIVHCKNCSHTEITTDSQPLRMCLALLQSCC